MWPLVRFFVVSKRAMVDLHSWMEKSKHLVGQSKFYFGKVELKVMVLHPTRTVRHAEIQATVT